MIDLSIYQFIFYPSLYQSIFMNYKRINPKYNSYQLLIGFTADNIDLNHNFWNIYEKNFKPKYCGCSVWKSCSLTK